LAHECVAGVAALAAASALLGAHAAASLHPTGKIN
jgi:hypothetical protein